MDETTDIVDLVVERFRAFLKEQNVTAHAYKNLHLSHVDDLPTGSDETRVSFSIDFLVKEN